MKKIIFGIVAIIMLVASCNNKNESQNDENAAMAGENQSEMPVAASDEEGQTEWVKQTTIMTSKPMVIDFFATWCGPCKELAPILDEIEKKHKGDVMFKRVDVDKEAALAYEFKIEAVPTLMFITPKGEYQTLLGLQEASVIEAKIAELLKQSGQ